MTAWERGPALEDWDELVVEWGGGRHVLPPAVVDRAALQVEEEVNLLWLPPQLAWSIATGEVTGPPVEAWRNEHHDWLTNMLAFRDVSCVYSRGDGPARAAAAVAVLLGVAFRRAGLVELDDCRSGASPATRPPSR